MPEWQRLALQGVVMVVTATLVVAISAWWSSGKRDSTTEKNEAQTAPPAPLFAAANNAPATNNAAAEHNALPSTQPSDQASANALPGTPASVQRPGVGGGDLNMNSGEMPPRVPTTAPLVGSQNPSSVGEGFTNPAAMGQTPITSMDQDAPFTMAPARPPVYPSTSPQRYQYPTTNPEVGPSVVPTNAGDSYPRVGDNLPTRPGAPR
jgi:hypothetical protein